MTIEEKAKSYYDNYIKRGFIGQGELAIRTAYLEGATEALASQWRSVEEELPEDDSYFYFVADVNKNPLAVDCAEYACETKKFSRGGQILHPTHWMHIPTPSLPDTNTEKR